MLKVWEKHKYTLMTFVAFTALWLAGDGWMTGKKFLDIGVLYHTLYYADISIGFVSRTFVATVLKFLTGDNITMETVLATINLNTLFAIVLFSVLIGSTIRKNKDNKMMCALTCVLAFSSVSLLNIISYGWTFTLDTYWLPVALLSILFIKNRVLRWFVPLLSFIGMWIHYAYGLALFPLVFLLLLYEMYENKKERKEITVLAVITALAGIASLAYFVFFASGTLTMSMGQTHYYISSRIPEYFEKDFSIIDAYCFNVYGELHVGFSFEEVLSLGVGDILKILFGTGAIFGGYGIDENALLSQIPLLALIEALWIYVFVKCKDKLFRFILLFNICYPIVTYLSIVLSTDDLRFASFGLAGQLSSLIWLLAAKNEHVTKAAEKITALFEKHRVPLVLLLGFILVSTKMASHFSVTELIKLFSLLPLSLLLVRQRRLVAICVFVACAVFNLSYAFTIGVPLMLMLLIDAVATDENGLYVREFAIKKQDVSSAAKKKRSEKKMIDELKAQKIFLITLLLIALVVFYVVKEFILSHGGEPTLSVRYWLDIARAFIPLSAFCVIAAVIFNKNSVQNDLCTIIGVVPVITAAGFILYSVFRHYYYTFQDMVVLASFFCFVVFICLPYKQNAKVLAAVSELENTKSFELYSLTSLAFMLALT